MKTVTIFLNPKSGKEKNNLQQKVKQYLINHGFLSENINTIIPKDSNEAFEKAKEATILKRDIIIPLGGDGTLNKIIGGVYEGGSYSQIGILPSGTVNNFAKALNIPLDFDAAMDTIVNGKPQKVDICKVNHHYMISSLTLGLLADIAADVSPEAKRKWGALAFLKDGFKILRRNRSYLIYFESKEETSIVKTRFLLVTMTNTIAGFPSFSPDALVNDGLLQVYTMKKVSFFSFLRHINEFRIGDFSNAPEINHFQTNSLTLYPIKKDKSSLARARIDGDKSDYLPINLQVIQEGITVLIPK